MDSYSFQHTTRGLSVFLVVFTVAFSTLPAAAAVELVSGSTTVAWPVGFGLAVIAGLAQWLHIRRNGTGLAVAADGVRRVNAAPSDHFMPWSQVTGVSLFAGSSSRFAFYPQIFGVRLRGSRRIGFLCWRMDARGDLTIIDHFVRVVLLQADRLGIPVKGSARSIAYWRNRLEIEERLPRATLAKPEAE